MKQIKQINHRGRRLDNYVKDYVVFDLETTGFQPERDAIIEISGLKVEDHKVTDTFSSLVRPGMHIPARASAVNGITDDMVWDAPELEEVMERFVNFIGDGILVGHNIHSFDMNFICQASMQVFQEEISNDYIDTLYMAKICLPQLKHKKLTDISAYFQIETEGAHRALNDCVMNQQCYERMGGLFLQKRQEQPELVCPKCGGQMVKRKGMYGEFYGCSHFPKCRQTRKI